MKIELGQIITSTIGFGQEGIVTSNLFKGAIAHQVLYHRSKGIIYNLGPDGWV